MVILKEPVEKAVKVIIDGQQDMGSWNYDYTKVGATRRDMSVTAWQVQALKACDVAGASVEGLHDAMYKAVEGIKSFSAGGGFCYAGGAQAGGISPTLTGAGILGLQFLQRGNDPVCLGALDTGKNMACTWEGGCTYAWYYWTQAKFQAGGATWKGWNSQMLPMLVKNQQADGHWAANNTHGASDVYDTCLCCLCLEVYYRYLPTYQKVAEVDAGAAGARGGDRAVAEKKVGDAL
jgi:hypothetical protein